jgi:hypothetical protein
MAGMKLFGIALLTVVGIASWPPPVARACSSVPCNQNAVFPGSGPLPANMLKIRFTPGSSTGWYPDAGRPEPRLYRLEGTTKVSVPFEFEPRSGWIMPTESPAAGTVLVLEADPPSCPHSTGLPLTATYAIGEVAPLPTTLGSLEASFERRIITYVTPPVGASNCGTESVDLSYADVRVNLATEARPYAELFTYQTYVDGQLYPRFRTSVVYPDHRPRGEERVAVGCRTESNAKSILSEGTHSVRFVGTLPDGTTLSTPELTIELRCDGIVPAWPDAGVPPASSDASSPDANSSDTASANDDDGCALASSRSGLSGLMLALALLLRRRR